jgi:glycosyltransferase involved in cell wall biosynthesis
MVDSSSSLPRKVLLVFLGKRGGGQTILERLQSELLESNHVINLTTWKSIQNTQKTFYVGTTQIETVRFVNFEFPHNYYQVLNPNLILRSIRSCFQMRNQLKSLSPDLIVQIMPSPFDFIVDIFANRRKIPVVRLIHDIETHPGEAWPTKGAIWSRIRRATYIIVFSKYIHERVESLLRRRGISRQIFQAQLPSSIDAQENVIFSVRQPIQKVKTLHIGFLGRARKYKGLKYLDEALDLLPFEYNFIAGGQGSYPRSLVKKREIINRWLSNDEFVSILERSDVIVLPYTQASQSGIIPIARNHGKWLLVSDVGGLREQVDGYSRAILIEPGSAEAIVSGLVVIQERFEKEICIHQQIQNHHSISTIGHAIESVIKVLNN